MKPKYSKLSVSLPSDMAAWLRRKAGKARTSVSHIIRDAMRPDFERRHAK